MELLHDRYRIERPLGSGGAGATWLAVDTRTGTPVTIKRLNVPIDAHLQALVQRETQLLSQLRHPGIPTFIEAFTETWRMQRYLHLVLAYVEGESLREGMARERRDQDHVRETVADLLAIVAWLHRLSPPVIHRDIKPSNVLRRPDGSLALIDFGLATDAVERTFLHTMAVGTLGYQAPEQIAGDPRPTSDVYSVGVLALELLTRRPPRELLSGQTLRWRRAAAHLQPRWIRWLEGALATDPARRFSDAAQALAALSHEDEVRVAPASATASALQGPTAPRPQRTRAWMGPGLLGAVLVSGVVAGATALVLSMASGPSTGPPAVPILPRPAADDNLSAARPSGARTPSQAAAACRAGSDAACLEAAALLQRPDASGEAPESSRRLQAELLGLACTRRPRSAEACVARARQEEGTAALRWWTEACVAEASGACAEVPALALDPTAGEAVRSALEQDCAAPSERIQERSTQAACALLHRWILRGWGGVPDPGAASRLARRVCPGSEGLTCLPADLQPLRL